ncbi:MAG: glycosyltransferase family 2 protein [Deltaproteobacteria bacterium]|nr:glycosyltransferase family 2 protein [Deltaproteobacteria bacterium]
MQEILVIVLNYNKKEMVCECLASLEKQQYQPCHVVVVDNASSDGSQEAIQRNYPDIDLLCNEENLGATGGRNAGVAYAKQKYNFDYIMFLDDDAEVGVDSIELLLEALEEDATAGFACGKTYINFGSDTLMSVGIKEQFYLALCYDRGAGEKDHGQYDADCYVDACGAFAFMIRASLFESLGGFDRAFSPYGWEEVDLCMRAGKQGHLTKYIHKAIFCHKGTRQGRDPLPGYERNKVKNYMTLMIRHMTPTQKICAVVFVPLRGLLLFARFARQGHWGIIPAQLKGLRDYFRTGHRDSDVDSKSK